MLNNLFQCLINIIPTMFCFFYLRLPIKKHRKPLKFGCSLLPVLLLLLDHYMEIMVWLLGCNLLQFHQSPWTSPTFKERNHPSDESGLSSDNPETRQEFSVEESKFPSRKAVHQAGSVNKNMSVICFLFFSVTPEASEEHSLETTWNLMLCHHARRWWQHSLHSD